MRRLRLYLFVATATLGLAQAAPSFAQFSAGGAGHDDQQAQDDSKRKKRQEEFGALNGPLPALKNAGPCPFVKVLYDAARYLEFKDNVEASANVVYTGEIQNITANCAYRGSEPIHVHMDILFQLGRGPQARASQKSYQYWVAVTDRNHAVLDKQYFDLPVTFPAGQDRVNVVENFGGVTIPRATSKVSGSNFEILTGFEVTPQMADFNRQGKRFKANAGQTEAATKVSSAKP
ncbi:MAG TPA: Tat pathway signal sequence domain protein [Caulobacteraceae bacterium]